MSESKHNPFIRYWRQGFLAGQQHDDYCPHMCGSKSWEWWWHGYNAGIS